MKDFINNIYSNDYFVMGLFIAIAVLTVVFIIVLYLAIKDAKKSKIEHFKNENNLDLDETQSEGKKVNSILDTAEFAFTTNPPEEVEIPTLTPLEEADTQELSFDYDPFKPEDVQETKELEVEEPQNFEMEVAVEPAIEEEVPVDENVVELDSFEFNIEEPASEETSIETPVIEETVSETESYEDSFKEFSFDESRFNESPAFEYEVEEVKQEPIIEINEEPKRDLEYTQRITLPEQFSSVYVDKKESEVVEEPTEVQTVEFEIKEPVLDMDEVKNIKRPHQLKRASILSQLPKLATEEVSKKEEVEEPVIEEPVIQEQPISALDRFETETYDISNK